MKYAIIENGVVVNIAQSPAPLEANWIPIQPGVDRGWEHNGTDFIDPETKLTVAQAKALAKDQLEIEYKNRLDAGEIGGMSISKMLPEIVKADMVVSAGANNFAVVTGGESQLMTATKLTAIKTYWNDCSNAAETHYSAIQALTTKAQIKTYVDNTLFTNWPNPSL